MRATVVLCALLVLAAGCESAEKKAERLNQERAVACLRAQFPPNPDSASVERARCDVATRKHNAFIAGN